MIGQKNKIHPPVNMAMEQQDIRNLFVYLREEIYPLPTPWGPPSIPYFPAAPPNATARVNASQAITSSTKWPCSVALAKHGGSLQVHV